VPVADRDIVRRRLALTGLHEAMLPPTFELPVVFSLHQLATPSMVDSAA